MRENALHQLLGAYLLGGLEPAEARAFEDHLARCADCRHELEELESLPAMLDAVPAPDAVALTAGRPAVDSSPLLVEPVATLQHNVLDELAVRRRKSRRRWSALVGAVAAACLALGFLAGPLLNQPPKPDASYSVQAGSGLQLTVGMVKKGWGTELQVDGRSLPLQGTMSLWVKGRDGVEDRACAWTATPSGRIKVTGATPVQLAGIAGVELRDESQRTVAAISVP
ncbi:anti-sigma factor [Arthrobacter cavernae]|uniref:Zf-HC2 domain-containing protein n=1 Tax=Arthrobacter cavernae TaxID=2817681 RepID=A0A939KNU0_9MICC|nr:zf-HC2 domain-containing protein [Arthrobacter cavernae]MBO1267945.1 zf-HC2 domain-containing protein [Arthrobacter cavernae]